MNGQHIRVCVGVVIQEMVQSEVSGVLFTNNPVNGSANQITINASFGLGEVTSKTKFAVFCLNSKPLKYGKDFETLNQVVVSMLDSASH